MIEELISAWTSYDAHRASAFFTSDATYHESGRDPIHGREAIFEHFKTFFRDGPAWRITVEEIIVEGPRAAMRFRFELKRDGDGWISREGCAFVKSDDRLISEWREFSG